MLYTFHVLRINRFAMAMAVVYRRKMADIDIVEWTSNGSFQPNRMDRKKNGIK